MRRAATQTAQHSAFVLASWLSAERWYKLRRLRGHTPSESLRYACRERKEGGTKRDTARWGGWESTTCARTVLRRHASTHSGKQRVWHMVALIVLSRIVRRQKQMG